MYPVLFPAEEVSIPERKRPETPEVACKDEDVNLSAGQENGGTILPHLRCHCPTHLFRVDGGNTDFCSGCKCYICDRPVSSCVAAGTWLAHSDATDADPDERKNLRERIQRLEDEMAAHILVMLLRLEMQGQNKYRSLSDSTASIE